MDPLHALFLALAGGIGGFAGTFFKWLIDRARHRLEASQVENTQALTIYHDFLMTFQPRIAAMEVEIRELTRRETECRVQNALLQGQMKSLREELEKLQHVLSSCPLFSGGDCPAIDCRPQGPKP
jgi:hypothetical protein